MIFAKSVDIWTPKANLAKEVLVATLFVKQIFMTSKEQDLRDVVSAA
jgi:hypothetical protein